MYNIDSKHVYLCLSCDVDHKSSTNIKKMRKLLKESSCSVAMALQPYFFFFLVRFFSLNCLNEYQSFLPTSGEVSLVQNI